MVIIAQEHQTLDLYDFRSHIVPVITRAFLRFVCKICIMTVTTFLSLSIDIFKITDLCIFRTDRSEPDFLPLVCQAQRYFICVSRNFFSETCISDSAVSNRSK